VKPITTKYYKENGYIEFEVGHYKLALNHPVMFFNKVYNEFDENETRYKVSFGIGFNYISNKDLGYFYFGFLILGFGIGISKQVLDY